MQRTPPRSFRQALAFIASYFDAPPRVVDMPLSDASGQVLAEAVVAPVALPRFDSAAMDGFAVRSADIAPDGIASLTIAQTIKAGQTLVRDLGPGEAARIMTGALVPAGTGRVVMQEHAEIAGDRVRLQAQVSGKPHIRRAGEDITKGSAALEPGCRIGPGQIALLAALGVRTIRVVAKPKVALLSTGDELAEAPASLVRGQIYDTNRPMLRLMLEQAGAEVTDLGIIRDDADAILATLVASAAQHDLIVSSAGASVGFADHLAKAVARRGYLEFWKLDMRPGKPIGFGDIDHCPILLLPGNPLAAAVGMALFGRAILERMAGHARAGEGVLRLPMGTGFSKPAGRTQILVGRLRQQGADDVTVAVPLSEQGPASLRSLATADVMIVLHAEQTAVGAGDLVDVMPLWRP